MNTLPFRPRRTDSPLAPISDPEAIVAEARDGVICEIMNDDLIDYRRRTEQR